MISFRHDEKTNGFVVFSLFHCADAPHCQCWKTIGLILLSLQKCCKAIGFIVFVLRKNKQNLSIIQKRWSRYRCVPKIASPEALKALIRESVQKCTRTHAHTSQNPFFFKKVIESQTAWNVLLPEKNAPNKYRKHYERYFSVPKIASTEVLKKFI